MALCCHRSGSTLAQVMACCLMVPSHYLNQCWIIISGVLWHPPRGNFTKVLMKLIHNICWEITLLKLLPHLPGANELIYGGHMASWNLVNIDWGNELLSVRHQAITWTSADILTIKPLEIKFSEILFKIQAFLLRKCIWKCYLKNFVNSVPASVH